MEKRLKYWLPPIAWMIMLFIFSSRQSIAVTHEFTSDFIIFKTLHIIEYAMLFFFVSVLLLTPVRSLYESSFSRL